MKNSKITFRLKLTTILGAVSFGVLSLFSVNATAGEKIGYITEVYPPYNYKEKDPNGKSVITGYSTEILQSMLKNMQIKNYKIKVLPWARGYKSVSQGTKMNMLYSTTRSEKREKLFKWVGPIVKSQNIILCNKSVKASIKTPADLAKYTYAVIRDDYGEHLLISNGIKTSRIHAFAKLKPMIKFIVKGRMDCLSYVGNSIYWFAKSNKIDISKLEHVYSFGSDQLYFAFSNAVPDATINEYQQALDKVKGDSAFISSLQQKYGF